MLFFFQSGLDGVSGDNAPEHVGEELGDVQGPVQFLEGALEDPVEVQALVLATQPHALVSPLIYDPTI